MTTNTRLRKVKGRSLRQWLLLGEAGLWLLAAKAALRLLPTARLVQWIRRPLKQRLDEQPDNLEELRWAVTAFSSNAPIRLVCFPQALAMHGMLRRRSIPSQVVYGAARLDDGKLVAHAWLRSRDRTWLGGEVSPAFTVIDVWKPSSPPDAGDSWNESKEQ